MPQRPFSERIKDWPQSSNVMDLRSRDLSILQWLMADAIANPNKPGSSPKGSTHYKTSKLPKPRGIMGSPVK